MNSKIIKNWNCVVKPNDRVNFLGDFGNLSILYRHKLHGNIILIKGNHDKTTWARQHLVSYRGLVFLLIHNPNDYTQSFNGDWIIHGHTHGNSPFINKKQKRINVSCEVINYTPIRFEDIFHQIELSSFFDGNIQYKIN